MPFCTKCGKEVKEGDSFCPHCGQTLSIQVVKSVPQAPSVSNRVTQRPTGITIIAILEVLGGLVFFGLGAIILLIAGILGAGFRTANFPVLGSITGIILGVIGLILVIIGIINFVIAYGYWSGRTWAWTMGMVFAVLGIIIGLITLPGGMIRIILDVLIVYYLTRPHVKAFFGKKPVSVTI